MTVIPSLCSLPFHELREIHNPGHKCGKRELWEHGGGIWFCLGRGGRDALKKEAKWSKEAWRCVSSRQNSKAPRDMLHEDSPKWCWWWQEIKQEKDRLGLRGAESWRTSPELEHNLSGSEEPLVSEPGSMWWNYVSCRQWILRGWGRRVTGKRKDCRGGKTGFDSR